MKCERCNHEIISCHGVRSCACGTWDGPLRIDKSPTQLANLSSQGEALFEIAKRSLPANWKCSDCGNNNRIEQTEGESFLRCGVCKKRIPGFDPKPINLTQCSVYLYNTGAASPRTCSTCGLGPCRFGIERLQPAQPAVAEPNTPSGEPPATAASEPLVGGYGPLSRSAVIAIEYAADRIAADNPLGNGKTALFWHLVAVAATHISEGHAKGRRPEVEAPQSKSVEGSNLYEDGTQKEML